VASLPTSPTLLEQLRRSPRDEGAWRRFVELYGGRLYDWCRQWGLQEADAEDVTQATLLRLVNALQSFEYDPGRRFRNWLRTVTRNVWQDLVRAGRRVPAGGDDPLDSVAAPDALADALEAAYEQELLDLALPRVRLRVRPQTWEAFRLTTLEGVPAEEAAARLGMRLTSVYKARSNVQKMLRGEVEYLEGGSQ
jgi:RNA polymerase sigma-70 factor (ECF subfamily)